MRYLALASAALAVDLSECGFDMIPIVYMNLDEQEERRARFETLFPEATRLRSVNGRNITELMSRLDYDLDPREFTEKNLKKATEKHFDAFPGEIGCMFSVLDAFQHGLSQGYQYMAISEDDIAVPLCSLWPSTLDRIIKQIDQADPEWEVLRLQWTAPPWLWHELKTKHFDEFREVINELGEDYRQALDESYGAWENAPILGRFRGGWGNVFNVWHRRGMQRFVDKYKGAVVDGIQRWKCPEGKRCVSDLVFVSETEGHAYALLPPWVQNEPGERGSMIREGQTNHEFHLSLCAQAVQWLVELREFVRKGSQDLYPDPKLLWRAVAW